MKGSFKRGFKSRCEEISISYRKVLGVSPYQHLPALKLAEHLGLAVYPSSSILKLLDEYEDKVHPNPSEAKAILTLNQCSLSSFSAVIYNNGETKIVIYNDEHSAERTESNLMHEMSHYILDHPGDDLIRNRDFELRTHNQEFEDEAKWLGSVLQIPEQGLVSLAYKGHKLEKIAHNFKCSIDLARFRWNSCGIDRRLSINKK